MPIATDNSSANKGNSKPYINDKMNLAQSCTLAKTVKGNNVHWIPAKVLKPNNATKLDFIAPTLESLHEPVSKQLRHLASRTLTNTLNLHHQNKVLKFL